MKLVIESIEIKNFLSFGSKPIIFTFETGIHAIKGYAVGQQTKNGIGKSALAVDAVSFAFFGKTIRKLNNNDIINSINGCDCVVNMNFRKNDKKYRIERGLKPGFIRLIELDKSNNDQTNKKMTQNDINNIIGINYNNFINIVTLNNNYSKPFFRMTTSEKRDFLEDIMNISVYGKMFDKVKKDYLEYKHKLESLEINIKTLLKAYTEKIETYKKLQTLKDTFDKEKNEKLEKLNSELIIITDQLSTNNENYSELKYKIEKEILNNTKKETQNGIEQRNILSEITQIESKNKKLTSNPVCSECGTPTTSDHIQSHIKDNNNKIQFNKNKLIDLKKEKDELQKEYTLLEKQLDDIKEKLDNKNELINKKNNLINKINETNKQTFNITHVITKESLISDKKELENNKKIYDEYKKNFKICGKMKEILGDSGVKTYVIKKIIPHINQKMNKNLSLFKANYTFKFDDQLNETLKSRNRDIFTYENFSSGEQKRIDLAWLFTVVDISKMRNSIDCNLFVLDELLDSSLCDSGIENLMSHLNDEFKKNNKDKCIYVITHRNEINEDYFDSVITLKKENSFTKIDNVKRKNI